MFVFATRSPRCDFRPDRPLPNVGGYRPLTKQLIELMHVVEVHHHYPAARHIDHYHGAPRGAAGGTVNRNPKRF